MQGIVQPGFSLFVIQTPAEYAEAVEICASVKPTSANYRGPGIYEITYDNDHGYLERLNATEIGQFGSAAVAILYFLSQAAITLGGDFAS
jgi:hypothetical protein